ncbi:hypothetical protein L0N00_18530, partial [Eggerthella lenta]|nr:hypothetical protein [Eggerthella lenta]
AVDAPRFGRGWRDFAKFGWLRGGVTQFTNGLLPRQTSQRENALVSGHIVGEVRVGIDILNVVIVVQRVH